MILSEIMPQDMVSNTLNEDGALHNEEGAFVSWLMGTKCGCYSSSGLFASLLSFEGESLGLFKKIVRSPGSLSLSSPLLSLSLSLSLSLFSLSLSLSPHTHHQIFVARCARNSRGSGVKL